MAQKNFIVAIELGSTKITGIAGQNKPDGTIAVLAVVREDATQCIRKGVVYNIDKTVQCITSIIQKLRNQLHANIKHVFIGVGGQSIHSVRNVIIRETQEAEPIKQDMVLDMMDNNRSMEYPEKEILDVVVQEYRADSLLQTDPVGVLCSHLEGNFLNILQSRLHYNKLNTCFENAGIKIAEMYLAPFALADAVLTPIEKRSGCVLVDMGADTTMVMVYHKDIVRHIAVIPLGGNNITKDLCSLQIDESEAENMKLRFASAYTPEDEMDSMLKYDIDSERKVDSIRFIELVEARVQEIIANVWNQVPEDFADKLVGGIILTGGGSNMKNIERAFKEHTKIDKVRIAKFVNMTISSTNSEVNAKDGTMNTIIGLLAKGDQNCWMPEEKKATVDIFGNSTEQTENHTNDVTGPRKPNDLPPGVIQTAAEKAAAEKAAAEKAAAEKKAAEEEKAAAEKAAEEAKKTKSGLGTKIIKWLTDLTKPEDE